MNGNCPRAADCPSNGYSPMEGIYSRDCDCPRDCDNPCYGDHSEGLWGPKDLNHPRNGDSPRNYDSPGVGNISRTCLATLYDVALRWIMLEQTDSKRNLIIWRHAPLKMHGESCKPLGNSPSFNYTKISIFNVEETQKDPSSCPQWQCPWFVLFVIHNCHWWSLAVPTLVPIFMLYPRTS